VTQDTIRWGIVAPGGIAGLLARELALVPGAELAAVGSRSLHRATEFAREYGDRDLTRAYGTYEEVLADPGVDVVYVASPHALHLEQASAALDAGKPVLCEKPLTLDRPTAAQLVDTARDRGLFLMEAMWMACSPVINDLRSRLRAGDFGTPRHLTADLSFHFVVEPDHRLRNPALGGGALLDLGIYPLTFAHLMLGEAMEMRAVAVLDTVTDDVAAAGGPVDLDVSIAGRYPGDALADLSSGFTSHSPNTARIRTDEGWLEVPSQFHYPTHFTFHRPDAEPVRFDPPEPIIGDGYGNEVAEVNRCLREGLLESPLVPHAQTLTIMGQLDALRRQVSGR
jgi:predicted dehydrogenase